MDSRQRRQQRKKEKHRHDRELARRKAMARPNDLGLRGMMRIAAQSPFGPTWVSSSLFDDSPTPALVTVVITRGFRDDLLPQIVLVDRTCLGVKNAFVMRPMSCHELERHVTTLSHRGDQLQPCEPLLAQSIVYHAIDYAQTLGFEPHGDFEESLLGPRPAKLLDTPLAHPTRPFYCSGPNDDVPRILRRLATVVGPGNYESVVAGEQFPFEDLDDDDPST